MEQKRNKLTDFEGNYKLKEVSDLSTYFRDGPYFDLNSRKHSENYEILGEYEH